ncbi:WD repeat-containing protein jip5 [Cyphellophora attinorum]|uniref:WD repeat-containing protein JIP5 n=1 Tax=Cyphellophora attinorum TaxID=1664694 RepID=A0A0N1NYA3_9EURO|nr:WD repeat-containing protein jip5 [Phialophora attinorum]KPI39757.1 WD repeat-containing protein jip5 [Phialophora attinorum]
MLDTICTLPLPADLFAQVLHPSEPIVTVGLSSGHVIAYRLPSDDDSQVDPQVNGRNAEANGANGHGKPPIISSFRRSSTASENGLGAIDTLWKTKRHQGSCRVLSYSHDGSVCYSGGTDGLVKAFHSENGKVVSKIAIPADEDTGDDDAPTVLHALSPQALLLATDSGKLYLHDLRQQGVEIQARAAQTWHPHDKEHVNSLIPLPVTEASTSGFPKQWLTVGGSTLVVTDIRKGVLSTSEDQEVELTSAVCIKGLKKGGTSVGEKVLVGQGDGIVSLWERGVWGDQDERLVVDRTQSGIESMVEVPLEFGNGKLKMNEKIVAAGLEDGAVRFLRVGRNGVLDDWDIRHDEVEGVVGLDFDVTGRLVSGGGQVVKVWTEAKGIPGGGRQPTKRAIQSDDSDDEDDFDDSSDEEADKSKRKKRKRNKGKDKNGGQALKFSGLF